MDQSAKIHPFRERKTTSRPVYRRPFFWLRLSGTVLGIGFLVWVLSQQAWIEVWYLLQDLSWPLLLLAGVGFLLGQVFNTLRWWVLLRVQHRALSAWLVFRLSWVGYLTSNFLPGSVGGDALRGAALLPYVPRASMAFASVVLDRILNLLSMLCLLPVTVWVFRDIKEVQVYVPWYGEKGVIPFVLAMVVFGVGYRFWEPIWRRLQEGWKQGFHPWVQKPTSFLWSFFWAWMSNLTQIGSLYILARGVGMPVSYGQVVGVHALIYLLVVLPFSLNGLGVAESAYVVLYPMVGATPAQAAALALLARLLPFLILLPGALWLPSVLREAAVGVKSWRQGGGLDGNA